MGTVIRPQVSEKNPYWIDRHRYYELKHFCLQYPLWKEELLRLDGFSRRPDNGETYVKEYDISDPTHDCAAAREFYLERISMVEQAAHDSDPELANYILKGVTEGIPYNGLKMQDCIPCCKDVYYGVFRKFFWLLSRARK